MKGVQFVVDDKGDTTAVVINLKQHSETLGGLLRHGHRRSPRERAARVACLGQKAVGRPKKNSLEWLVIPVDICAVRTERDGVVSKTQLKGLSVNDT